MSLESPRQLLDKRLAAGEITPEEHGRLVVLIEDESGATKDLKNVVKVIPFILIVVLGWYGFGYYMRSKDFAEIEQNCVEKSRSTGVICSCFMEKLNNTVSVFHYIPIVRNFVGSSLQIEESRANDARRQCQG